MGAGTLVGVFNGIGVAVFRVPPFMMTLAMSSIVFGLALTITGGTPIYGMPTAFAETFGYADTLRSITQGRAAQSLEFDDYEPAPEGELDG